MSETTPTAGTDLEQRFLALIRDSDARLRRICRVYGRASGEEADLYQEIVLQVWRALPSFEGRSRPGTWIYRIALNTALGQTRRRAVRRESSLEQAAAPDMMRDPAPGADETLERAQRLERLYAAIDSLDDTDKALVMLYLDEHSYREMADVLGITEDHVGVKLHRIRRRMGEWLAEEAP